MCFFPIIIRKTCPCGKWHIVVYQIWEANELWSLQAPDDYTPAIFWKPP